MYQTNKVVKVIQVVVKQLTKKITHLSYGNAKVILISSKEL